MQLKKCINFCPFLKKGKNLKSQQIVIGEIADFNMWSYEMSEDELNSQTCGSNGDVASWDTLEEKGVSLRTVRGFPICNSKC